MAEYYYLDVDGQTVRGPVDLTQARVLAESGELSADALICKAGSEDWSPLHSYPELEFTRTASTLLPAVSPPRSGTKMFLGAFLGVTCAGLLLLAASRLLWPVPTVTPRAGKSLDGEVFIVTRGGQNFKLGLVPVLLYRYEAILPVLSAKIEQRDRVYEERDKIVQVLEKQDVDAANMTDWCSKQMYYLSTESDAWKTANDAYYAQKEKSDAIAKRHKEAIARRDATLTAAFFLEDLPKPLLATQTNSDGKFSFSVKDSKGYVLIAEASRSVGEETEHYYWFVSATLGENREKSIMLSNQNVSRSDPLLSLASTLAP